MSSITSLGSVVPFTSPSDSLFTPYKLNFKLSGKQEDLIIRSAADEEQLFKIIINHFTSTNSAVSLYFDHRDCLNHSTRMKYYQELPFTESLQFSISTYANRTIIIRPQPITIEELGEGTVRKVYANGIIVLTDNGKHRYSGSRIFPDGQKEVGKFEVESDEFACGYKIDRSGNLQFINPTCLVSRDDVSRSTLGILEVEGRLIAIEKNWNHSSRPEYKISEVPIELLLLKMGEPPRYGSGPSIKKVLLHKDFESRLPRFIETSLAKLGEFSITTTLDILEIAFKEGLIDAALAQECFFMTHSKDYTLLERLTEWFPELFLTLGQEVIAKLLEREQFFHIVRPFIEKFIKAGGVLDSYHTLWMQVASRIKPDESFERAFDLLSSSQKQVLYNAAYTYQNPFLHEPAEVPITSDQYSINFMWINKNRMGSDQEFLFEGFQKGCIQPISMWAKTNPGSVINLWIDSAMATVEAIERSRTALKETLEEPSRDLLRLRDVRTIKVVQDHPSVFSEVMPIYFRVDLLRAAAADHLLRAKENKYFVYGDLDMTPLSSRELFDKRTIHFLSDQGIVLAKGGHRGFENGFQILNGECEQLMDSHRKVIVDLSIDMAEEEPRAIQEQQIYDTYPAMFIHFFEADGRYGRLMPPSTPLKDFRRDRIASLQESIHPGGCKRLGDIVPRKAVQLPPSHF